MQLPRQNSIYGNYPYNRLGIMPNASNLNINMDAITPLSLGSDQTDFPSTGLSGTVPSTGVSVSPLDRLFGLVKDNTNSMVNLVIVVIILVAEHLVKGNLFTCPCDQPHNTLYGVAFLSAPAAALFVVGVMANNKTWILVTGCCHRYKTDYTEQHQMTCCYHIVGIITKSLVAPLAWVIISFIDGKFYACAASSDPCNEQPNDRLFLQSKSQVIGYVILMVAMFGAIFGLLLWRAARPLSYEQNHYINIYRVMERHEIHRQFEEHAQAVARQNVKEFLAKEARPKRDWDYIANVPSLTPTAGAPNGEPPSMSPLNKLVQKERRESMDKTAQDAVNAQHDSGQGSSNGTNKRSIHTQVSAEYVPLDEIKVEFTAA